MQQSSHDRDQMSRASRAEREWPTTHTASRCSQQSRAAPRRTAQHHARAQSRSWKPPDRPTRTRIHAHPHRPQAHHTKWATGSRGIGRGVSEGHPRGIRGLVRPHKAAIPTTVI